MIITIFQINCWDVMCGLLTDGCCQLVTQANTRRAESGECQTRDRAEVKITAELSHNGGGFFARAKLEKHSKMITGGGSGSRGMRVRVRDGRGMKSQDETDRAGRVRERKRVERRGRRGAR